MIKRVTPNVGRVPIFRSANYKIDNTVKKVVNDQQDELLGYVTKAVDTVIDAINNYSKGAHRNANLLRAPMPVKTFEITKASDLVAANVKLVLAKPAKYDVYNPEKKRLDLVVSNNDQGISRMLAIGNKHDILKYLSKKDTPEIIKKLIDEDAATLYLGDF